MLVVGNEKINYERKKDNTQAVKNLVLFYGKYGLSGILSIIEKRKR